MFQNSVVNHVSFSESRYTDGLRLRLQVSHAKTQSSVARRQRFCISELGRDFR